MAAAAPPPPATTTARDGWEEDKFKGSYKRLPSHPPFYSYTLANNEILNIIRNDRDLINFTKKGRELPKLLSPKNYNIYAQLSYPSTDACLYLATERGTGRKVVMKVPNEATSAKKLREILKEYMFQSMAYQLLQDSVCTVPQVVGLIRMGIDDRSRYCLVTCLCSYLPGGDAVLSLAGAVMHAAKNPGVGIREIVQVLLAIIRGLDTLQKADIYHTDVRSANICLQYYNNTFHPVFTSFSGCSRRINQEMVAAGKKVFYFKFAKEGGHIAPELFEQVEIHPTSVVHSLAWIVVHAAAILGLPGLQRYSDQVYKNFTGT